MAKHQRNRKPSAKGRTDRHGEPTRGEWLYGRHPVLESLRAHRRPVYELRLALERRESDLELEEIVALTREQGAILTPVPRRSLDDSCRGGNHQGLSLNVGSYPYGDFADLVQRAAGDPRALVLMLDHMEDPQNLGSLLRSADAAGVTGVVIPEDRAASVTPAVVRASAGAAEHLRVARVVNLPRAIERLKAVNTWVYGLDMDAEARPAQSVDLADRTGIVVGAEGPGLGRLVRERCDGLMRLPMRGRVASLNAAVAGAIALFEALRQRETAS